MNKLLFLIVVFLCLIVVHGQYVQVRPGYQYNGLLPAQVPQHELVGIDLYLDTLLQFAAWCIGIALTLPLFKLLIV